MCDRRHQKLCKFIAFGKSLSELSTCKRRKVACVIFPQSMDGIAAIGYNGRATGENNDECTSVEGDCGCVHAEANALLKLNDNGIYVVMYTTCAPCWHCAGLIVNSQKISHVFYSEAYRDTRGIDRLKAANIGVTQI
jgi:deoxycytidylate deaminase